MPDPKDVAAMLKKSIFKSKKERQREAEVKRDVQVRMAKSRIQQHILRQKDLVGRYRALAKKALSLNDEGRFRQVANQLMTSERDAERWEKYLLSLEMLETRREQVRASVDLLEAVQAMGDSLQALAEPAKLGELQAHMEKGLAKAASLDERMELMMGMMDSALQVDGVNREGDLANLETALLSEIETQEGVEFDPEIEKAMEKIRSELKDK